MKKFNLEQANMGAPVITRSGLPVEIIDTKKTDTSTTIVGWIGNVVVTWSEDGRHRLNKESELDIFINMPEEYYINIYKDDEGLWASEHMYETMDIAVNMGEDTPYFYTTTKVSI